MFNDSRRAYVKFRLSQYNYDVMMEIFNKLEFLPLSANINMVSEHIKFGGISPRFDSLQEGDTPKTYSVFYENGMWQYKEEHDNDIWTHKAVSGAS